MTQSPFGTVTVLGGITDAHFISVIMRVANSYSGRNRYLKETTTIGVSPSEWTKGTLRIDLLSDARSAFLLGRSHAAQRRRGHRSGKLTEPAHLRLLSLPPYAPALNPVEHLWNEREKHFHNRVFVSLNALEDQPERGLRKLENDPETVHSIKA
jgi:transposase